MNPLMSPAASQLGLKCLVLAEIGVDTCSSSVCAQHNKLNILIAQTRERRVLPSILSNMAAGSVFSQLPSAVIRTVNHPLGSPFLSISKALRGDQGGCLLYYFIVNQRLLPSINEA
jgi:hypothetical protein